MACDGGEGGSASCSWWDQQELEQGDELALQLFCRHPPSGFYLW